MSEHEHDQQSEPSSEEREETIEDLDVAEGEAADVKGGLWNNPIEKK
ncbi:MAG: hypothetical protein AABM30_06485 [Actinomycetota bacterium]